MAEESSSRNSGQFPQNRYKFIPDEMTWNEHDSRAMTMGGHLASITNAEENEQVTRIAGGKPVWIGGIRKGRGNGPGADNWYWTNGRPWSYTNWHPGEPNSSDGRENRVHLGLQARGTWNDVHEGWRGPAVYEIPVTGSAQSTTSAHTSTSISSSVTVSGAGSPEVNGTYVFKPGEHENRHWGTIAGHYQHTQNPEIFIAFQDCGKHHQRPEWNKWMIISKIGVLYAAHTGGKIGVPPREGEWETVDSWGNPGAPGGKHPAPTLYHPADAATKNQERAPARWQESIEILEAVPGKPVRFKINNPPSSNDAWVGIYHPSSSDQEIGKQKQQWEWLRDLDVNNASLPEKYEGNWSIRVFSDGGYRLHERKDFQVKAQTVAPQPLDETAEKPGRGRIGFVALFGLFLLLPGLPLLIIGSLSSAEDNLAMIIPGAILTGIGGFLVVGAWFAFISSRTKSYAETGKPAPRWTKVAAVFAVLLLIPGVTLLVIGSISAGSFVVQSESNATLEIFDIDDMGDQGFIIFLEGIPGDSNNNGMHDYCENLIVNATHSGSWMSNPWQGEISDYNEADETRQVFELQIAHDGSGCSAEFWPEEKHTTKPTPYSGDLQVSLVKIGVACYGCMKGTTTISAEYSDGSKAAVMWIQDGEKIVEATALIIAGSIMTGLSSVALISLLMVWGATRGRKQDGGQKSSIEILEATTKKGVYFRINNPPSSNDAWVGIYPRGSGDSDHGDEGVRWHWLRDIDVNKARFYEKSEGRWSIRVFSDSGFTLDSQDDFEILPPKERWWED